MVKPKLKLKPRRWAEKSDNRFGSVCMHVADGILDVQLMITKYQYSDGDWYFNIAVWQPDSTSGCQIYHNAPFRGAIDEAKLLAEEAYAAFLLYEFE